MIKFIKKHKLNFISYLFCAFAMALFTIISFSCKTYAYSIDGNGNLVGDNLWNIADTQSNGNLNVSINNQTYTITATANSDYYAWIELYTLNNVVIGKTYTMSYNITANGSANTVFIKSAYGNIDTNIYDNTDMIVRYDNQRYEKSFTATSTTCVIGVFLNIGVSEGAQCIISNIMLNEGDTALEWEPYGVWYSSSNYETLQNQLSTTNGLLDLQIDITKYGWLSYIDNLEYYVTGNYVSTFTFEQLKTNNYISNNATLDLYTMSLYQNPNYSYIKFDIYFQNSYANLDYFSANLFDISTKLGFNGVVSIYDTDSNSAVFNITDIASITYEDIIEKNSNFGDYIYNVVFEFASPDASTMIYTNSFYSRGYQTGYSYGSNVTTGYYTPIINDLNGRISNLENNILSLNNTIDTLKELNAQYQQQLADNVGWSSLFFAFADTPFKVVSNVLGFELFGLNLFATFIGMITVFGVVYLLKKFL